MGGQILPAPCNTATLKDMDLKFACLNNFLLSFQNLNKQKKFMQISQTKEKYLNKKNAN